MDPSVIDQICIPVSSLPSPSTTKSIGATPVISQLLPSIASASRIVIQNSVQSSPEILQPSVDVSSSLSSIIFPQLPSASLSAGISSTVKHFTKRTATRSTLLLSTTLTYTYTSVSAPVQTLTVTTDTSSALPIAPTAVTDSRKGMYIPIVLKMYCKDI